MFAGPLAGHRSLLGIDYLTRDATVDWLGHTATVVVSSTIHEGFHGEPLQSSFERCVTLSFLLLVIRVFLKICSCWAAEVLLGQLKDGTARFELLQPPAALAPTGVRFFARIGSSLYVFVSAEVLFFFWLSFGFTGENVLKSRRAGGLPATKKVEHYTVQKVKGDGRCMFRALVRFLLLLFISFIIVAKHITLYQPLASHGISHMVIIHLSIFDVCYMLSQFVENMINFVIGV